MSTAYGSDKDLSTVKHELSLFQRTSKSSSELSRGNSGMIVAEAGGSDVVGAGLFSGFGVTVSSIDVVVVLVRLKLIKKFRKW